ncbi:MAG: hypothetical protein AAGF07_03140 [Patescibacteria group bacterium]
MLEEERSKFNPANSYTASFAVLAEHERVESKQSKNLVRLSNLKQKPASNNNLIAESKGSISTPESGFGLPTQIANDIPVSHFNTQAPNLTELNSTNPSNQSVSTTSENYTAFNFPDLTSVSDMPPTGLDKPLTEPKPINSELFSLGAVSDLPPALASSNQLEEEKLIQEKPASEADSETTQDHHSTSSINTFTPPTLSGNIAEDKATSEFEEVLPPAEIIKNNIEKLNHKNISWENFERILNETRPASSNSA